MFRLMIRLAALALVVANLTPAAFAAPRASRTAPVDHSGLGALWERVVSIFAPVLPVSKAPGGGIMEKAGSHMDPDGAPFLGTNSSGATSDAGVGMDPDGR
jgi:hypothetical protein